MSMRDSRLEAIAERDGRYAYEAFEFLVEAMQHTLVRLGLEQPPPARRLTGERPHVSGRHLLEGICDLAQQQFGLMARVVFRLWGIQRTEDFGQIVFLLVEEGLLKKAPEDSLDDFANVFDLEEVLVKNYRIELEEGTET